MMAEANIYTQNRHWLLTYNNPVLDADDLIEAFELKEWKYVFQKERGGGGVDERGGGENTEHFQIYLRTDQMYCCALSQEFVDLGFLPHIQAASSWKQAMIYCTKEDSRISESFYTNIREEIPVSKKAKLLLVKKMLDSGFTLNQVMDQVSPDTLPTCFRNLRALTQYAATKTKPRNFKTIVFYLEGNPGCGKSRLAFDICNRLFNTEVYYKSKGKWWDGYCNNDCVIWDNFFGDCYEIQELLKLCDRYEYRIQIKGGFIPFSSRVIIFTSNKSSEELYFGEIGLQFQRRIEFNMLMGTYDGDIINYSPRIWDGVQNYCSRENIIINIDEFINNFKSLYFAN